MTTPMSYDGSVSGTTSYINQIATLAVVAVDDPAYVTILPQMIANSELRIYRELDFLFSSISTTAYGLTVGSRDIIVPAGTLVVAEQINVLTPAGTTNPDAATRNPLLPTTKEYLDAVWGNYANTGLPQYWVPFDDYHFLVGPYPDQNYQVEIVGTYRPDSMSATNPTTFISLYLPDLFIYASMVYISGFQRNFNAANSNDPGMPGSWEQMYQVALKSALEEESRKKFESAAWSSQGASKFATPTRG